MHRIIAFALVVALAAAAAPAADQPLGKPPEGFKALFSGQDLSGWHGLVGNPKTRAAMTPDALAEARAKSTETAKKHWRAEAGELICDGGGPYLCTDQEFADFELLIDWKITPGADSGIYLRGTPQVQIWDPGVKKSGSEAGSGGLYNNKANPSKPLVVADNPAGEWNSFRIKMVGDRVTIHLNDKLVVDNTVMENYWDRAQPMYPKGQIELQTHGGELRFRNVFIRELPAAGAKGDAGSQGATAAQPVAAPAAAKEEEGFRPLFNGKDMEGWQGSVDGYIVENGMLVCDPKKGGTLLTKEEFSDFIIRFEFRLPPGGNNGLAIRTPPTGNPAYVGMEIQILDDTHEKYKNLKDWQFHGSIYGVVPAKRGSLKPVGEWNSEEVEARGSHIIIRVNGQTIVDADLEKVELPKDSGEHPGIKRTSGHIGFMGHGDRVEFRNIRIKPLK